jgi:2,4-dienoyl-CoA reductase-like NADH-dependent reductase (Old Yellow Enzyme family)
LIGTPLTLPCGAMLANRLVKAAMSEQLADASNNPSDRLISLYWTWANSGASALVSGNVMIEREAISEPGQVVIEDESAMPSLVRWAEAAKSGGAQAWLQLNHGGRQIPRLLRSRPVAPSAVPMRGPLFGTPTALESNQIEELIERYARSAAIAVRAGFTGVQVHGAHGYLISQFLSPLTNRRNDQWGGDPQRRRRFLSDVLAAVRKAIGPRAVLALKLNASDFQRGGIDTEEALGTVEALSGSTIDVLEVSGGTFESAAMLGVRGKSDGGETVGANRDGYFVAFAQRARERLSKPLMVTGGFRSARAIEDALASGAADLIGLARPIVLNAELPRQLLNDPTCVISFDHRLNPPLLLRSGLFGGMAQIAWHTVQLWQRSEGTHAELELSPTRSVFKYLAVQTAQLRARSSCASAPTTLDKT